MPLGNGLGEFVLKATSVRHSDLGGGQTRIEVDFNGESKGQLTGLALGTLTVTVSASTMHTPNPWTFIGNILGNGGEVVAISGQGMGMRTGDGHKIRYRGAVRYMTADPKLAALNNVLAAVESEADPATMTLKGAACEWK